MTDRDITNDSENTDATTLQTTDRFPFVQDATPDVLKEIAYSNIVTELEGDLGTITPDTDLDGNDNSLLGWSGSQNAQTGTTYSTQDSDNGKIITLNNASAITLTVHSGAAADFNCLIVQLGAGQVTVAAGGTGAILNADSHTKLSGQYAAGSLYVISNAGTAPQVLFSGNTAA